jgi:UDP-4-amino-4,6-dideoxy-N-acetyl-beta-L-altrosamine transaminase
MVGNVTIPYGRQSISEEDIQAVAEALRSDFLTQGPLVPKFEQAVCDYTGSGQAVAVNSGTAALHVACLAMGLGRGDWLWTTPITFAASANCGLYCGAQVDFVDIDPITWNISVDKLHEKLASAKTSGKLPKILVAVHLSGLPCDMAGIRRLSEAYGFRIIEDACHAIGGRYQGEPVGRGSYSDATVFSFHPVKTITTGEGGMALTNDRQTADRMRLFRSHGITRDPEQMTRQPDGPWYYEQIELGFNYRMTDIQAALGISQLKRLDDFVDKRHAIASHYNESLRDLPLLLPARLEGAYSGMHLYVVRIRPEARVSHKEFFERLRHRGIGANLHYIPVHLHPYYRNLGFRAGDFPEAERYYAEAVSLPIFPDLGTDGRATVCAAVRDALG